MKSSDWLVSGSKDNTIKLTKLSYNYRFLPGSDLGIHAFKKLATCKTTQYNKSINEITLMPQRINILHVLAHQGREEMLQKALEAGCHFLESAEGKTPLSISLERNKKRCTEVILKYIKNLEDQEKKRRMLSRIGRDLPKVLQTNSPHLTSLCQAFTFETVKPIKADKLPIYDKTQADLLSCSSQELAELRDVKVGRTNFKFNFLEGSQNSLEVLRALKALSGLNACEVSLCRL